jgi:hypothetical protein
MIVVSKDRYLPITANTMVLFKDERFFYVHRDVYDQAVVLTDRYPDMQELRELVGGTDHNDDTVLWFAQAAPRPLHILAPYLSLIDGKVEQDIEICCGALHVITAMIHARNFILKPVEVRKCVSFSLTVKEEYQMAWDRFLISSIPYSEWLSRTSNAPVPEAPGVRSIEETQVIPAGFASFERTTILTPPEEQPDGREGVFLPLSSLSPSEAEKKATRQLLQLL